jgi:hypothetical protein
MYCSSCSNSQCFICSVSVTNYSHFSDSGPCRLYGDDESRVNAAVMRAQGQAIMATMRSRDGVGPDGLTVDKTLLPPEFNTTNDLPATPKLYFPQQVPPTYTPYQDNPLPFQVLQGFTWQVPQNGIVFGAFPNNPEPSPYYFTPQGPPTYTPYQDNPLPLQGPNGFTWPAPQNGAIFGAFPMANPQYTYIEQHTAFVNPSFVRAPIDHGLSTQPQFHPPRPGPQYPVAMNATGPIDAVAVTYEAPWHNEDDPDGDQSKGKRSYCHIIDRLLTGKRKSAKGSVNRNAQQTNPDHLPRTQRGGSLVCDLCRQGKRGKKVRPAAPKLIAIR